MHINCWVHIFSGSFGSFGSAVDRRRNKLYACKSKRATLIVGFIYLVARLARLARQWIEGGINYMRVRANEPNEPARLVHG